MVVLGLRVKVKVERGRGIGIWHDMAYGTCYRRGA